MNLGNLATVVEGDIKLVTMPFAGLLSAGAYLTGSAIAAIDVWPYSLVQDANAAGLIFAAPIISGTNIEVLCGGFGSTGFQPGVVYSLWASVATSLGETLTAYGQIICDSVSPPNLSDGGVLPTQTIAVTTNTTAYSSAVYILNAPGLTLTLAASWSALAGAVIVADNSGAGGTAAGDVKNWPGGVTSMALTPYGSMTFVWSAQLNGWVSV